MIKTAIVYHYLAQYRQPIFEKLMSSSKVEFTLVSGLSSDIPIKKIENSLATKSVAQGGLRWIHLNNRWLFKNRFLWQFGLLKIVLRSPYEAFIFLGSPYHLSTWIAVIVARLRKKKVYYWMHGINVEKLGFIDHIKLKIFYRMANGFFLYGNRAAKILKSYSATYRSNTHVIYNSLNYSKSLSLRKEISEMDLRRFRELHFADETLPVISFIGRLNKVKKIDMLLDAQNLLNKDGHNSVKFNIILIGDGEEKSKLIAKTNDLGLSNHVKFFGAVYEEETIAEVFLHSDICVTPGEVGLTAMHAMSYGTPVFSHNNLDIQMPEVEAIIPGITGELYNYGSVSHLSELIDDWITKYPFKLGAISENCYNVIDNYYNPEYQKLVLESVLFQNIEEND